MAQREANRLRQMYLEHGVAFGMETVFSDPKGDKISFIVEARRRGYFVVLVAIGLESAEKSLARVALRVLRGGHNVPADRVIDRYPRVLANFKAGARLASLAIVIDNSEDNPNEEGGAYQPIAVFVDGHVKDVVANPPAWCQSAVLPTDTQELRQ